MTALTSRNYAGPFSRLLRHEETLLLDFLWQTTEKGICFCRFFFRFTERLCVSIKISVNNLELIRRKEIQLR